MGLLFFILAENVKQENVTPQIPVLGICLRVTNWNVSKAEPLQGAERRTKNVCRFKSSVSLCERFYCKGENYTLIR